MNKTAARSSVHWVNFVEDLIRGIPTYVHADLVDPRPSVMLNPTRLRKAKRKRKMLSGMAKNGRDTKESCEYTEKGVTERNGEKKER